MNLEACLPEDLRRPTTTIARIAAGLSGAGVYRIEAGGRTYVLKISNEGEPLDGLRRRVEILRLAADAGLAPAVIHVNEAQRSVLSAFVIDRSFPAFYGNPLTRETALTQLGRTMRRVHELPMPDGLESRSPLQYLAAVWSELGDFPLPAFVGDEVRRVLAEQPPTRERSAVLSHNDVNPTNLVYDGEKVLLLDWDVAGSNDPFYDLAAIAVFFRMDDDTCRRLLEAYDGKPVATLPDGLAYHRRLVATLCGVNLIKIARQGGHPGAAGNETLESTATLGEFIKRVITGSLSPASAEGQWMFGLALVKASTEVHR